MMKLLSLLSLDSKTESLKDECLRVFIELCVSSIKIKYIKINYFYFNNK
jgi:hypothetical protein